MSKFFNCVLVRHESKISYLSQKKLLIFTQVYFANLLLRFGKIIRNSLFLFKSDTSEKADCAYNL